MTLKADVYLGFGKRLEQAMNAKSIKFSATVLAKLFNAKFDGRAVNVVTARNWMLGRALPTQDKLILLAKLLDTSAEYLLYGRESEKTLILLNAEGSETELTFSQQQLVRKYISLNKVQQRLISDLVDELAT